MAREEGDRVRAVVIGYGNPLRGDDGAGRRAAALLAGEGRADLLVLERALPDPADLPTIVAHDPPQVFLVDAVGCPPGTDGVVVRRLGGGPGPGCTHGDGASYADLISALGCGAAVYQVLVAGCHFQRGEGLSPTAQANARRAARRIMATIGGRRHGSEHDQAFPVEAER
jgi:hydrogenase maturation protease